MYSLPGVGGDDVHPHNLRQQLPRPRHAYIKTNDKIGAMEIPNYFCKFAVEFCTLKTVKGC